MRTRKTALVAAALAVTTIGIAAGSAQASQGQPVLAGQQNTATDRTYLSALGNQGGIYVDASGGGRGVSGVGRGSGGAGVHGFSYNDTGVVGVGAINGVQGVSGTSWASGVYGENSAGGYGLAGRSRAVAVWGDSTGDNGIGVQGNNYSRGGIGLYGAAADPAGTGVYASNPTGVGLSVNGRAKFSTTGRLTIPAGQLQATAPATLAAQSLVLATPQQRWPGVSVEAAVPNPAAGTLTVYLSKPVPADTAVAWFVLN